MLLLQNQATDVFNQVTPGKNISFRNRVQKGTNLALPDKPGPYRVTEIRPFMDGTWGKYIVFTPADSLEPQFTGNIIIN
jgi:hypothetical protein